MKIIMCEMGITMKKDQDNTSTLHSTMPAQNKLSRVVGYYDNCFYYNLLKHALFC